jgi:hypothetical protein
VEIDRPALDSQRDELLHHYPWAKTLVSFVVRINREPARSSARSVANLEFHHSGELVDEVGRRVVRRESRTDSYLLQHIRERTRKSPDIRLPHLLADFEIVLLSRSFEPSF